MQYTLIDLLQLKNIAVGLAAKDSLSAIRAVNDMLVRSGKTLPAFGEDACTREATFPTGLPTRPVAVAIPHADPPNVLETAVAIATLGAPVQFAQMGTDGSTKLDVHAIFLLAIKEQTKQVEMIQQLMKVIQNQALLEAMTKSASPQEMLDHILVTLKK